MGSHKASKEGIKKLEGLDVVFGAYKGEKIRADFTNADSPIIALPDRIFLFWRKKYFRKEIP